MYDFQTSEVLPLQPLQQLCDRLRPPLCVVGDVCGSWKLSLLLVVCDLYCAAIAACHHLKLAIAALSKSCKPIGSQSRHFECVIWWASRRELDPNPVLHFPRRLVRSPPSASLQADLLERDALRVRQGRLSRQAELHILDEESVLVQKPLFSVVSLLQKDVDCHAKLADYRIAVATRGLR